MPYGGHSAIGLIILLYEVTMPHINNAAYDLSTPADSSIVTGVQTPTGFFKNRYFSLFSLSQNRGEKSKKKYHLLVKELLSYHLLFFWLLPAKIKTSQRYFVAFDRTTQQKTCASSPRAVGQGKDRILWAFPCNQVS